jgi:mannose-6-phosphate isomerase
MTALERTVTTNVPKPWGSTDLSPWSEHHIRGTAIGEIWYERPGAQRDSALLMKLLFTTAALSIQVHPDDTFAHSIGLAHGKSEAWYILSALPNAKVAVGLKRRLSAVELRTAIASGAIADLVQWRAVKTGELIYVPPGTIHSIGAGLVIMEIQQRSDATFRLFDYGRTRELHTDHAVLAANAGQAGRQAPQRKLTKERTLLVDGPNFVLERFDLPPGSDWELRAAAETWLYVLEGGASVGEFEASANEVIFLQEAHGRIRVRAEGLKAMVAYVGSDPVPDLLRSVENEQTATRRSQLRPTTTFALVRP